MRTAKPSQLFLNFSANECKGSSRLYEILSKEMAQDEELLELSLKAKTGQPLPNLFFGAVHYLLLKPCQPILSSVCFIHTLLINCLKKQ